MSLSKQLLQTIGREGSKEGQLKQPCGLAAWHAGEVVVADRGNSRVQVFDRNGQYKYHFSYDNFKRPFDPVDIAVTRDDSILVTDYSNCKILVFDRHGQMIDQVGYHEIHGPWGITVRHDGSFYVVDRDIKCLVFYDMYGSYVKTIGGAGQGLNEFRFPLYVATAQDGNIYISDSVSQAVKVFDTDGNYSHQFSLRGQKAGHIFWPTGVAVDKEDNVIVAEFQDVLGGGYNRLQRFKSDGTFIDRIDSESHDLSHPEGLAVSLNIGSNQKLYVSDWGNNCVKVYQIYVA
ncbi:uncharacterized protein LOC144438888 [Glandiceps talaboti]